MNKKQRFRVGSKIVDYGKMYKITRIEKGRTLEGDKEERIYYKSYFKFGKNQSLVCSISKSNLEEANIRKPVSKKKINKTIKLLGQKPNGETKISIKKASACLKKNDPIETAQLLKLLWLEKQNEEKGLNTRKRKVYQNATRCLVEEIAIVKNISLKKARKEVNRRLKKICPVKQKERK